MGTADLIKIDKKSFKKIPLFWIFRVAVDENKAKFWANLSLKQIGIAFEFGAFFIIIDLRF